MSVIVTGGAGFIGSCIIRELNDAGIEDIIVVDNIAKTAAAPPCSGARS